MTSNYHLAAFARRTPLTLHQRLSLNPDELARRRLRRRLLNYIVETHRRREAARGRGLPMGTA